MSSAISAVDTALWDLKAQLLGQPLTAVFGRCFEEVPVYGSGGFTTYSDATTTAQLEHWVGKLGITRVKIKIGESWGTESVRDLGALVSPSRVVGDDVDLFVDANGAYSVKQAIRQGGRFADEFQVTSLRNL